MSSTKTSLKRFETQTNGFDEEVEESKEGMSASREARGCEDSLERHDCDARDGGICGRRLQWKDLQSGRDQALDDWPLFGRVLHHV